MNDCIIWPYSRNIKNGNRLDYGQVRVGNKMKKAHRVAWEKAKGSIPDGLMVLHKCDNPPCINVDHLYLGTHSDNAADRQRRGRGGLVHGSNNGRTKITEQTAVRIKALAGVLSASSIARSLKISITQVCAIMKGEAWACVNSKTRYKF